MFEILKSHIQHMHYPTFAAFLSLYYWGCLLYDQWPGRELYILLPRHTINDQQKYNSVPGTQEKIKKLYFRAKFVLKKKTLIFNSKKCSYNYIFEGNGTTEVEENNSNGTFVCDGDAHKVILCPRSPFFCMRWVLLRSKKPIEDNPWWKTPSVEDYLRWKTTLGRRQFSMEDDFW